MGNFSNFGEGLGLFGGGAVVQALLEGGQNAGFGVLFDSDDKGKPKGFAIGLVEVVEAIVFFRRQAIEARSGLLLY